MLIDEGYMRLIKTVLAFLLFFMVTNVSNAIEAEKSLETIELKASLSMNDCIKKALENSPAIKKQKLNYDLADKELSISKAVYFPTVGAGGGYKFSGSKASRGTSNSTALSADATIKQLIWNFGKTSANIRMEKFNRITALYDFDNTVLTTIFDVKTKYYAVLAAKASVEVDKANIQINERSYQRTKAFFEEGLKSKIDLVNSEVYLTDSKVALVKSENAYKTALVALNNAMFLAYAPIFDIEIPERFKMIGEITPKNLIEPSNIEDLTAPPKAVDDALLTAKVETTEISKENPFDKFPYTFEECLELANKNRPDLKAYDSTLKAMEQYLLVIKRKYFPEITAQAGYNLNDIERGTGALSTTNSLNASINFSSSVNILSEKYEIDSGKIQVGLAQNEIELLKQNVYFEIQGAYVNMLEYEKQIPLLAQGVRHTLENLELADGRYSVGLGDYIELQDAKVNYNVAQHSYVKGIFNYQVARAKLEQAIALEQEVTLTLGENKK